MDGAGGKAAEFILNRSLTAGDLGHGGYARSTNAKP
jgi:hypothetical protein